MNKSIGPNLKYIAKIEEQSQIIEFLKQKYKESTGYEAPLPQNLASSAGIALHNNKSITKSILIPQSKSLIIGTLQSEAEEEKTNPDRNFYDAVANLQLPYKVPAQQTSKSYTTNKKPAKKTSYDFKNPFHMIEVIDLSNYKGKVKIIKIEQEQNFNRQAFRDFLESIQDMAALHTLNLQNNGIDDSFNQELAFLVSNTKVVNLNISHNEIGPKGIEPMITTMRQGNSRFHFIDLTRNNFSSNQQTIKILCEALIACRDLTNVAIDSYKDDPNFKGGDQLCKMVSIHKSLNSVTISDSKISTEGIASIFKSISMTQLSLKFCFLHVEQIKALSQHLKVNKTLVYLDLKHNGLENESGQYISEMLAVNYHLHCVNLENNLLGDDFIIHLCQSLQKNNTLAILKLGYNSIGERGAKQIISLMGVGNDTIEDLGDIGNNPMGLGLAEQINQQLTKNNNMRKGSVQKGGLQEDDDLNNFKILKPINFLEALQQKPGKFKVWNI